MVFRKLTIFILTIVIGFIGCLAVVGYAGYRYYTRPKPKALAPVQERTITLIEGWTVDDMATYFEKEGIANKADTYKALDQVKRTDYPVLASIPPKAKLEGFLFPDTYRVLKDASVEDIVAKLISNFQKRVAQVNGEIPTVPIIIPGYEDLQINGHKGMTLYEVVTLASILEKESGVDLGKLGTDQQSRILEERKTIAGIFLNRLRIGKALESDATINYATKENRAAPTGEDLDVNSPYNTYKNPGLPPGPINNPSIVSIDAVLHPIKTDYFYFLHKQPSGEVVYSKTFEEHVANKFKYLK